jgi:hypothetical protein
MAALQIVDGDAFDSGGQTSSARSGSPSRWSRGYKMGQAKREDRKVPFHLFDDQAFDKAF